MGPLLLPTPPLPIPSATHPLPSPSPQLHFPSPPHPLSYPSPPLPIPSATLPLPSPHPLSNPSPTLPGIFLTIPLLTDGFSFSVLIFASLPLLVLFCPIRPHSSSSFVSFFLRSLPPPLSSLSACQRGGGGGEAHPKALQTAWEKLLILLTWFCIPYTDTKMCRPNMKNTAWSSSGVLCPCV
jgi:hypothetical protein